LKFRPVGPQSSPLVAGGTATVLATPSSPEPGDASPVSPRAAAAALPMPAAPAAAHPVAPPAVAPAPPTYVSLDLSRFPLEHHLLHSALAGEDKLEAYALEVSTDKTALRARVRFGNKACGHPRIVHGGALASILDDALGTLFLASGRNGFTANLSVDYRKPLPAGTDVFVQATIDRVETSKSGSHKVFLSGAVVAADDPSVVFTQGSALFIAKPVPASADLAHQLRRAGDGAVTSSSGGSA
jgi:acyl-coenzyme A thioesterase PaaI-like protein